jgi:hypothetical protein
MASEQPKQPPNAFILFMMREKEKGGAEPLKRSVVKDKWDEMPSEEKKVRFVVGRRGAVLLTAWGTVLRSNARAEDFGVPARDGCLRGAASW